MAKFYGSVGYVTEKEVAAGVWEDIATEKKYRGDIVKNLNRWQQSGEVNDNINIDNKISIISDPYAYANLSNIRYVEWMGERWKVNSIEVVRPRLVLSIGGIYNGSTP